jgi:UDP-glucuronate 4-epimerase
MTTTLVTGAAGFVGFHLCERLLARGEPIVGLDNLNPYYDVGLKRARLARLMSYPAFRFVEGDIADRLAMAALFATGGFNRVAHLAAQAGVRYSITNPHAYADSNLVGFLNILEGCRQHGVGSLVYASSSSVYGANQKVPFAVSDPVNSPVSLYAATKRANELMAHTYSHLYQLRATGLRFFTVYGPWGRPDMAYFLFAEAILKGEPIAVFNHGAMRRDFTYIDDIIAGMVRVLDNPATAPTQDDGRDPSAQAVPHRIYNIGRGEPVRLLDMIEILEGLLGRKAIKRMMEMQPGDVTETFADVSGLARDFGYAPSVSITEGLRRFAEWFVVYKSGTHPVRVSD